MNRIGFASSLCTALLVTTAWASDAPAEGPRKLNVLFVAVDDLRPDLGCYGHPLVQSPNIDRLASRGMVFNRSYCQQAVCNSSRASLMTGLRPETLKVYELSTHFRDKKPDALTIPEHFKKHGYFTQRFGKIFHLSHGNREDPQSWSEPAPPLPKRPARNASVPAARASRNSAAPPRPPAPAGQSAGGPAQSGRVPYEAPDVDDSDLPDGQVADQAIEALRRVKDRPFFLAVGFYKPHLPFIAPRRYWDLYSPDQIELAPNPLHPKDAPLYANNDAGELRRYRGMPQTGPIPDDEARRLRHGYYACISYMDAQVGRVLAELDRLGLRDHTVVILWGDHGWQLGEHGTWCKHTAWETATRAPLIISLPHQKSAGARTDALVEFVDIFPSLVDICGLPMPTELDGISFKPLIDDPGREWKRAAFSIWPKKIPGQGSGFGRAIRTDRYRLVEWTVPGKDFVEYELYDHQTDPRENTSLAKRPEYRALVEQLTRQLHAGWQAARPPNP